MVIPQQIQAKLTDLTNQKYKLAYEQKLHEQKIDQIKAAIEVINGATTGYQDWLNNLLAEQAGKKEAEESLSDSSVSKDQKEKE